MKLSGKINDMSADKQLFEDFANYPRGEYNENRENICSEIME